MVAGGPSNRLPWRIVLVADRRREVTVPGVGRYARGWRVGQLVGSGRGADVERPHQSKVTVVTSRGALPALSGSFYGGWLLLGGAGDSTSTPLDVPLLLLPRVLVLVDGSLVEIGSRVLLERVFLVGGECPARGAGSTLREGRRGG